MTKQNKKDTNTITYYHDFSEITRGLGNRLREFAKERHYSFEEILSGAERPIVNFTRGGFYCGFRDITLLLDRGNCSN